MYFSFLHKKYVVLNNKSTIYKQKKNLYFEFTSISPNFPGNNQKISQIIFNGIFSVALLSELFWIDITQASLWWCHEWTMTLLDYLEIIDENVCV